MNYKCGKINKLPKIKQSIYPHAVNNAIKGFISNKIVKFRTFPKFIHVPLVISTVFFVLRLVNNIQTFI